MRNRILRLGLALVLSSAAFVAAAEDTGWKMPNVNPFASKTTAGGPPTSGWKMPKLWPKKAAAPRRKSSQPSTLSKMTSGTKNLFSKTADAINPWDDKPAAAPPKITGSNSIFTQQRQAAQKKDASSSAVLPASWWGGDKTAEKPKSVNDFLSQQRP
jgi:hypothetical protein